VVETEGFFTIGNLPTYVTVVKTRKLLEAAVLCLNVQFTKILQSRSIFDHGQKLIAASVKMERDLFSRVEGGSGLRPTLKNHFVKSCVKRTISGLKMPDPKLFGLCLARAQKTAGPCPTPAPKHYSCT
jgi:hypothetical protein